MKFGPLNIRYDSSVITPRPWTFAQSAWAAEVAADAPAGTILELCAGAGHIGLVLAALSGRSLVQVDVSASACRLARANAGDAGLAGRVDVRNRPLSEALHPAERFPVIVADPPYIPSVMVGAFDDPVQAIDGGTDGLDVVRSCCGVASRHLVVGGLFSLQLRGLAQWEQLAPELDSVFTLVAHRGFGPDRAVVHLTRS